jgi:hypothetical protein
VGKVSSFFISFFSSQRLYMIVKLVNRCFPFRCLHNKRLIYSLGTSQKMSQFLLMYYSFHLSPLEQQGG